MNDSTYLFAKALADETRQQIMRLICCQWLSVNEIVARLNLTQPTISHHLSILREAGLVRTRQQGKFTFYTLNQEQVAFCCSSLMVNFAPQTDISALIQKQTPSKPT
ncbi:MAG: Arsenical resistance operon repressor [Anaerolineae bacterium]|jgi:DNA-binding transcriptional ArsR family regulator|nr:MAG: Arsenical resistance operon repressor [Anaerolineae bacterium]